MELRKAYIDHLKEALQSRYTQLLKALDGPQSSRDDTFIVLNSFQFLLAKHDFKTVFDQVFRIDSE